MKKNRMENQEDLPKNMSMLIDHYLIYMYHIVKNYLNMISIYLIV